MNVELLLEVKKTILAEPKRLNMRKWLDVVRSGKGNPSCGTVACIAGWAMVLSSPRRKSFKKTANTVIDEQSFLGMEIDAQEKLGITDSQAQRLFYTDNWPMKFWQAYEVASGPVEQAQAAADRIDHFIKTKGR